MRLEVPPPPLELTPPMRLEISPPPLEHPSSAEQEEKPKGRTRPTSALQLRLLAAPEREKKAALPLQLRLLAALEREKKVVPPLQLPPLPPSAASPCPSADESCGFSPFSLCGELRPSAGEPSMADSMPDRVTRVEEVL
jgi:hypothetical protein